MKKSISSLRTTFREEMCTKLDVIQTNQKQVDTGLTTFDLSVTSVIKEKKEEGTKIKVMVDRHIEKMIKKQEIFFVFFTSQFYFLDDIFSALKHMIFCAFLSFM
jgi:hypothetical protein